MRCPINHTHSTGTKKGFDAVLPQCSASKVIGIYEGEGVPADITGAALCLNRMANRTGAKLHEL